MEVTNVDFTFYLKGREFSSFLFYIISYDKMLNIIYQELEYQDCSSKSEIIIRFHNNTNSTLLKNLMDKEELNLPENHKI